MKKLLILLILLFCGCFGGGKANKVTVYGPDGNVIHIYECNDLTCRVYLNGCFIHCNGQKISIRGTIIVEWAN